MVVPVQDMCGTATRNLIYVKNLERNSGIQVESAQQRVPIGLHKAYAGLQNFIHVTQRLKTTHGVSPRPK